MSYAKHHVWVSIAAFWGGMFALFSLPFRSESWAAWLVAAACVHVLLALNISVGIHRLFCHGAFKTSRAWHWALAVGSVFALYGSPLQWSAMHMAHHKHSDTELDPHPTPGKLGTLFNRGYRDVPMDLWRSRRLASDSMQRFVHRAYLPLWLLGASLMGALAPEFFLNAYLPGVGILHMAACVHNMFAHWGGNPRDLAFMEFLVPSGGEWLHKSHHEKQGAWRFGKWDMGARVISWIKSPDRNLRAGA